jgi:hypothetical protein
MTGIAVGSLIVAVFALAWTIYRDIATRADVRQERADRKDQLAREEGRREEEIRLLRLQVERQQAISDATERAEVKSADLIGKSTGYSGHSGGVDFPMSVRNVGTGVARDVRIWLAFQSSDGAASAAAATGAHELGALVPNDPPATFTLTQANASAGGGVPRDGLIFAEWKDDAGDHSEPIGKLTLFL